MECTSWRVDDDGKGKVSARLPSYYATLLSYCSHGGAGAEGVFANARSGERLLLPATLSSRISPTVHAQFARVCAPLFVPECTAVAVVRGDV
jgi:hypothetical protein